MPASRRTNWAFFQTIDFPEQLHRLVNLSSRLHTLFGLFLSSQLSPPCAVYSGQMLPLCFEDEFGQVLPERVLLTNRILKDFSVAVVRGDYGVHYLRHGWNHFVCTHSVDIGSSLTFLHKGGP